MRERFLYCHLNVRVNIHVKLNPGYGAFTPTDADREYIRKNDLVHIDD